MTPNERTEKILMNVKSDISLRDAIAAEIAQAVKLAREEEREYWVKAGTRSYAEEHNRMLRKEGKAEAYEDAIKNFINLCGVNPATRRPCFYMQTDERFWCPVCVEIGKIRARAKEIK